MNAYTPSTYDTNPVHPTSSINNNKFRTAFEVISKAAIPYLDRDAYFSDLLWDAETAAKLKEGEHFYLLVRDVGTNTFTSFSDAASHCTAPCADGKAVIKVMYSEYGTFRTEVVASRVSPKN